MGFPTQILAFLLSSFLIYYLLFHATFDRESLKVRLLLSTVVEERACEPC
jgi:hypothetical protein